MSNSRNLCKFVNNSTGKLSVNSLAAGSVIQVKNTALNSIFVTSQFNFVDIPNLSITITPNFINSKFIIIVDAYGSSNFYKAFINVLRNGTILGIADGSGDNRYRGTIVGNIDRDLMNIHGIMLSLKCTIMDSPNTLSPLTYKLQMSGRDGYSMCLNRSIPDRQSFEYDDRLCSQLTVMEVVG